MLVVGAGVAGCAAAIHARRNKLASAVVSGPSDGHDRIERLAPRVSALLDRLGLDPASPGLGAAVCPGIRTVDGEHDRSASSIFDPHGHGWTVRRQRLRTWLREAAIRNGVQLVVGSVRGARRAHDLWAIDVEFEGGLVELSAKYLLVATGRSGSLLRKLGARIERDGHPVLTLARRCSAPPSWWCDDPLLLVERGSSGWHYASLHGGAAEVVVTVPASGAGSPERRWEEAAVSTQLLSKIEPLDRGICWTQASSALRCVPARGEGWTAIGDVCLAHRPVEGLGVAFALESAILAVNQLAGGAALFDDWLADYAAQRQRWAEELLLVTA